MCLLFFIIFIKTKFIVIMSPQIKIIRMPELKIYQDSKNEWRWKIKVNGETIAASTEGYINRKDCIDNILNVEKRISQLREKGLIL